MGYNYETNKHLFKTNILSKQCFAYEVAITSLTAIIFATAIDLAAQRRG